MIYKRHQCMLSFRLRLRHVCSPEIIHNTMYLCCFLLSETFSYYLYLMDLTLDVSLYCSNVAISFYSPKPAFLRCDKAQWVKLDGSACDAVRSRRPPQPWLFSTFFISFVSLYLHYGFRHQRLKLGVRQKTKSHVFPWELKALHTVAIHQIKW